MNLGGLGAVYPGYLDAMKAEGAGRLAQTNADTGEIDAMGRQALGRALFQASMPGASPMPGTPAGGPQPPPPGQASMPAPPPMGAPDPSAGGGMPGQAGIAQPPQQGMPPAPAQGGFQPPMPGQASQPGGMPQLDLQTVISRIQAANPGIKPEVLMSALERAAPILSQQAKQELMSMRLQNQQERTLQTGEIADRNARIRELEGERKQGRFETAEQRRNTQFREKQDRLNNNDAFRQDATWQRLEQQRQETLRKAQTGNDRVAITQWRAVVDAQYKRAQQILQSSSVNSMMRPEERAELLRVANEQYATQMEQMRAMREGRPGGMPGAGSEAPPAEAPTTTAPPAPAASPGADMATPPPAALKEGVVTTFANGTRWTLEGGQPKQVP